MQFCDSRTEVDVSIVRRTRLPVWSREYASGTPSREHSPFACRSNRNSVHRRRGVLALSETFWGPYTRL